MGTPGAGGTVPGDGELKTRPAPPVANRRRHELSEHAAFGPPARRAPARYGAPVAYVAVKGAEVRWPGLPRPGTGTVGRCLLCWSWCSAPDLIAEPAVWRAIEAVAAEVEHCQLDVTAVGRIMDSTAQCRAAVIFQDALLLSEVERRCPY